MAINKYFIYKECYFCYLIGDSSREGKRWLRAVVMRADILKGGEPLLVDKTILVEASKIREATEVDYKQFNIKYQ